MHQIAFMQKLGYTLSNNSFIKLKKNCYLFIIIQYKCMCLLSVRVYSLFTFVGDSINSSFV